MKSATFILIFLLGFSLFSQTKDEREVSVRMDDFPINGQSVLKELPKSTKKLRLYKETDGKKVSYEAKFKYKNNRYSAEFDTNGTIEDIEMSVKEKTVPKDAVESYFQSHYKRFTIIKLQKQYINNNSVNDKDFLLDVLNGSNQFKINFEIVAEVKTESHRDIIEFLFTEKGEFINSRVLKPTSYEHIMY